MPVTCPARQLTATGSRACFVGVSQHNGALKGKDLLCIWREEYKDIQQFCYVPFSLPSNISLASL